MLGMLPILNRQFVQGRRVSVPMQADCTLQITLIPEDLHRIGIHLPMKMICFYKAAHIISKAALKYTNLFKGDKPSMPDTKQGR